MSGLRANDREPRASGAEGPIDRRAFVRTAGAFGVGLLLPRSFAPFQASSARRQQVSSVGIQLYTVRRLMAKNVEATISELARIGYRQVELAGLFAKTPREMRAILDRHGLTASSSHVGLDQVRSDWGRALDDASALGQRYIVIPSVDEKDRTADGYKRVAAELTKAGEEARKSGMQLGYHNHNFEFSPLAGESRVGYDILLAESDPSLLKMEMDIYWLSKAGRDPVTYFAKHPGRFPLVHVKDMGQGGGFADVGAGSIDFRRIFAHGEQGGIRHYFVEHDEPPDPLESARASYSYLHDLRW